MLAVAGGMFAVFYFASLYVQGILGFTPVQAGLAFLPLTAGIILFSVIAQQLIGRMDVRWVGMLGMATAAIGLVLLSMAPVDGSYAADVLPGLLVMSAGLGFTFVPLTLIATTGVADEDAGLASGLFNSSQQIGGALGLAILSTVAASTTTDSLAGGGAPTALEQASALVDGYQMAFAVGAGLMIVGVIITALFIRGATSRRSRRERLRPSRVSDPATLRSDAARNRARIIAAASELFAESGADLSVDEIARRAGVGHATVFRRFPTKEDLVLAMFEERLLEVARVAEAAEELEDPWRACGPRWSTSPPSR